MAKGKKLEIKRLSDSEIDIIHEKIGKAIKERREGADISQEHFAYESGVSRSTYIRVEYGKDVTLRNFLKILYSLGTSPEEFFSSIK